MIKTKYLAIGFILGILLVSLVSASWFSNVFGKITGDASAIPKNNQTKPMDFSNGTSKNIFYFSEGMGQYNLPVYSNYNLSLINNKVTRAIIVIHGTGRNAGGYFDSIFDAAEDENVLSETLILSPHFLVKNDAISKNSLYWDDNSEWKVGDKSSRALKKRVSSFEAVDKLVEKLNDKSQFPFLKEIVIAGHSAGGQFVNRYAAGNKLDSSKNIPMRYIVANPSSYMYFNPGRIVGGKYVEYSRGLWVNPNLFKLACSNYNNYRYGLENKNSYMSLVSDFNLRRQYESRKVTYLLGEQDTDLFDEDLDKSCAAEIQGTNRKARGENYFKYLKIKLPDNHHKKVIVDDTGHSARAMFNSPEGISALFE